MSNAKGTGTELDVKELLTEQVDSIALLGHISHELACVRRYKIKSVLKPEFATICADTGQSSKFLFGDDLQKQLKEGKGSSSFGQVVKTSQGRNASHNDHTAPGLRGSFVRREIDQTNYHLRNTATDLTIPQPKREFLKKSFKYSGAMLWNQLPNEAKLAESPHSFKSIVGQRHAS